MLKLFSFGSKGAATDTKVRAEYKKISPEEAKRIMNSDKDRVILDVRTPQEYNGGHIEGAKLLPNYDIPQRSGSELPDKNTSILVYCQSGVRSAGAAKMLANMGYENVFDFGGIISWPYKTVR